MSPVTAQCPGCGADVAFRVSTSLVTVCEFCGAALARGDRGLEDLGRVGDLLESESPLSLWLAGRYCDTAFQVTGRTQLLHSSGGTWDEWYLSFDDGRWGWLAEAQGKFYLTFAADIPAGSLPAYGSLEPGAPVANWPGDIAYVAAEKGRAEYVSAQGEIPYRLEPKSNYYFADLSGPENRFATVSYGANPNDGSVECYQGYEVTLDELGLSASLPAQEHLPRREIRAERLACPNCDGSLQLNAPDKSMRVACPYCDSLLDVDQGSLRFLKALGVPKVEPLIPLWTEVDLEEGKLKVIGFLRRTVTYDGNDYPWDEYLLYESRIGFRWLVCSDGHWNYMSPISAGAVRGTPNGQHYPGETATYQGKDFKIFQDAKAQVRYVAGEFYWQVRAGELAFTCDYVNPPLMLSAETSRNEINWSLGRYLDPDELRAGIDADIELPTPVGVGPNQPFRHGRVYRYWGLLLAAAMAAIIGVQCTARSNVVATEAVVLEPQEHGQSQQVVFTPPMRLRSDRNVAITAESPVNNSWIYVEGALYNEDTGLVQSFQLPVEYYHGVSGGESWSEGSQEETMYLSALPGGTYSMRLAVVRKDWRRTETLIVRVRQGVARYLYALLVLLAISILPAVVAMYHLSFTSRRWSNSDYATTGASE